MSELLEKLNSLKEESYREFTLKLVSSKYCILGVRVPALRKLAKEYSFSDIVLSSKSTFEEIFIYGVTLSKIKNVDLLINKLNDYLPFVDNWSICDMVVSSLKLIKQNKQIFFNFCENLLKSGKTYYMRFAIVVFLFYYTEKSEVEKVYSLFPFENEDYYFLMAVAWLNATYLIYHEDLVIEKLKQKLFNDFVIRKTISKANESFRVNEKTKLRLKGLKDEIV